MNVALKIIWYNSEIIGLWFGNTIVFNIEVDLVEGIQPKQTNLLLPLNEAIKFSLIFITGLSAIRLSTLTVILQKQIGELKKLRDESNKKKPNSIPPSFKHTCEGECNDCNNYEECDDEITQLTNAEFVPEENLDEPNEDEDEKGWD